MMCMKVGLCILCLGVMETLPFPYFSEVEKYAAALSTGLNFPSAPIRLDCFVGLGIADQPPLNFVIPWLSFCFLFYFSGCSSASSCSQMSPGMCPWPCFLTLSSIRTPVACDTGNPRKAEWRRGVRSLLTWTACLVARCLLWWSEGEMRDERLRCSCLGNGIVPPPVRESRRKGWLVGENNSFRVRLVEFELPAGHSGSTCCHPVTHIFPSSSPCCQGTYHHSPGPAVQPRTGLYISWFPLSTPNEIGLHFPWHDHDLTPCYDIHTFHSVHCHTVTSQTMCHMAYSTTQSYHILSLHVTCQIVNTITPHCHISRGTH